MTHDLFPLLIRLLEESPDAFGILDGNNQVIFCNQRLADIFGLQRAQAIGKTHRQLMQEAFHNGLGIRIEADDFDAWITDVESRQRSEKVRVFESDMHSGKWLQVTQLVIDDYLILMGTDITPLKDTEHKLHRALQELQQLAHTDPLTQIANRRSFFIRAGEELMRAHRYQRPLSLVLLDLDYFKQINDLFGHQTGDDVLSWVAAFYLERLRRTDFLARMGGEEFVILLPETDSLTALELTDRLRAELAVGIREILPADAPALTISAGISLLELQGDTIQTLLSRADAALYQAKALGRNRCELAPPWPSQP